MIQQVVHEQADTVDATVPAGVALATAVAKELQTRTDVRTAVPAATPANHAPVTTGTATTTRTPEVAHVPAVPQLMGLRTPAERTHRHKVPLRRLTAMAA
jgi:hypothetical protein